MFHRKTPGESFINRQEYRDKVLGCWTGKNIGGTLGAPLEGRRELFDVTFYTQDLRGNPVPNDDLDLQLAWLRAVETNGVYHVDERILAESWLACVIGPWGEYGVARFNLANGLPPPLSGICNNEQWKNSNGAWIRSELWACLFPGEPDEAVPFAWCDACVVELPAAGSFRSFKLNDGRQIPCTTEDGFVFFQAPKKTGIPADCMIALSGVLE